MRNIFEFVEVAVLALIAGLVFAATHEANDWIFKQITLTDHIAFLYMPAFLRLANVLVFGWRWGTVATFTGGLFLITINSWPVAEALPNNLISSVGGAIALGLFTLTTGRDVDIRKMSDWLQLTMYCTLANTSLHHLYWFVNEPKQIVSVDQVSIMLVGDVLGTVLGAAILSRGARFFRR